MWGALEKLPQKGTGMVSCELWSVREAMSDGGERGMAAGFRTRRYS
jgi:hypothetical protein